MSTDLNQIEVEELATIANKFYDQVQDAGISMLESAWKSGEALNAAKAKLDHGEWKPWLAANFHGSYPTASRYMLIASNISKSRLLDYPSIDAAEKAIRAENAKQPPKPKKGKASEPKPPSDIQRIDAYLQSLIDDGYVHTKNAEGREKLTGMVESATGLRRSHGALEQRWDKLGGATPKSEAAIPPPVDLSKKAKADIDREVRRQVKAEEARLKSEFAARVKSSVDTIVRMEREGMARKVARADHIIKGHKGILTDGDYNLIRSCLHPDTRNSVTEEKLAQAFRLFNTDQVRALLIIG